MNKENAEKNNRKALLMRSAWKMAYPMTGQHHTAPSRKISDPMRQNKRPRSHYIHEKCIGKRFRVT